jgi:hypothetical protein
VRAPLVVIAALLLCATRGSSAPVRVALTMEEPVGVARDAEPVTIGVPLPAGAVRDTGTLWIADGAGRRVPAQMRVLEQWPDGSARWVLLDFLAGVGARETVTYSLRQGAPPRAPAGPSVRASPGDAGYTLDSGAMAADVGRTAATLLGGVRLGTHRVPVDVARPRAAVAAGKAADVGSDGRRGSPATADGGDGGQAAEGDWQIRVETEGPVRTELLATGRDANDLAYELRIAAFAGTRWLRLQLTVTSLSSRTYLPIRSLPLVVGVPATHAAAGLGGATKAFDLDRSHDVVQPDARRVGVDGVESDGAADGWMRAAGDDAVVTVVRRWFAEEWPQRLTVSRSAVTLDLLAGNDAPVDLGIGAAKTFELWIAVDDPAHAGDPAALAARLQHPLVPHVAPVWTAASGALPNAIAPSWPGAADFLPRLDVGIARYLARNRAERWDDGPPVPCDERRTEHERTGAFGALNWGDWNFPGYRDRSEGCDAWGNLEYDLTQVLGLAFAATGSRASWDAFVAAARHYRDVDVVHHAPGYEEWVGMNHPHKASHFAVESPNKVDLGHTWLEGLVTHYRMTGEVRSLAAARGIADVLVRRAHKAGNPRQYGWPMIAIAAAYDATGDTRYRDAAAAYASAAVVVHEPTPAAGDWKMGILADGLTAVHAITADARLREWLVRYADALVAAPDRYADPRYALPLGYLARTTGRPRYREVGLTTVAHLAIGDWGKTLAISGRTAFRILGGLGPGAQPGAGATPDRAAPRRPSGGAPRSPSRPRAAPAPQKAR